MSKFSPSSQNFDGGSARRRRKRGRVTPATPGPVVREMVAVKRIGIHKTRDYCPVCGQKLKVCRCGDE